MTAITKIIDGWSLPGSAATLARALVLVVAYVATGKVGLLLAAPPGYVTLIWPPSGIAIAALILYGRGMWSGLFVGSFILNAMVSGAGLSLDSWLNANLGIAALIAIGSTVQALVATIAVERLFGNPLTFRRGMDVVAFFGIAGPISCLIAASVGVGALHGTGMIGLDFVIPSWTRWWLGDVMGVLVFVPLTLILFGRKGIVVWRERPMGVMPRNLALVLLIPLAITFLAWHEIDSQVESRIFNRFKALTAENEIALGTRMAAYETGLRGGVGFFAGTDQISRDEWKSYVEALDVQQLFPGINGIGFIADVTGENLSDFIAEMRLDGVPDFDSHPKIDGSEHFIITYIEPVDINKEAVGLDIAFERNRYEAATLARDTGHAAITGRILLVQDQTKSPGFLLLQPIYASDAPVNTVAERRAAFRGWVYAPFVGRSFMRDLTQAQGTMFNLRVFDGEEVNPDSLIYQSQEDEAGPSDPAKYSVVHQIEIMQKPWTLEWTSTPAFEVATASNESQLVLGSGLALTGLIGVLMMFFVQRTETISQMVAQKTKEIAASEETFRSAMESASVGMLLLDLDERVITANTAACDFFGYGPKQFAGRAFGELVPQCSAAEYQNLVRSARDDQGKSGHVEQHFIHKDGSELWGLMTVSLAHHADGSPRYYIMQVLDVTERHEMDLVKGEFISVVSHELRTPLSSIRGSLGFIIATLDPDFPEDERELLEIAHKNSERLIHLINDILDIDKIAAGKMRFDFETLELGDLIWQAIAANQSYAERFGVNFVSEPNADSHVRVDAERLIQVLTNLLSNAAKFSPEGGSVRIGMERHGDHVRILVSDNGPGIPEGFRAKVFQRFSQADSSAGRAKGGTGLGLHISKQIVERMGGSIDFTTEVGVGTTFHVDLPLVEDGAGAGLERTLAGAVDVSLSALDGRAPGSLPRILHIEEDLGQRQLLTLALQDRAEVVSGESVDRARSLLNEQVFDLIVVEPNLLGEAVVSLLGELSGQGSSRRVPIVALSVEDVDDDIRDLVAATLIKSRSSDEDVVETILANVA